MLLSFEISRVLVLKSQTQIGSLLLQLIFRNIFIEIIMQMICIIHLLRPCFLMSTILGVM